MSELSEILTKLTTLVEGQQNSRQYKAISGTPNAQLMFGAGGLFSNYGLDETVINAHMAPVGLDQMLPVFPTVVTDPVYTFITGFESDGASEVDGVCDDAPSGEMEVCHQVAAFGRFTRSSKEMEVNTLMQVLNGHLTTDLRVMGSILGDGHKLLTTEAADRPQFVQSVIQTQLVIIAIQLQQLLVPKLWSGTPANNSTGGGYKEFPGLEMLVATGKIDAFTGDACGALDPDVKDFAYNDISGTAPDIVQYLSMIEYYVSHVATRSGMMPVEWVLVMRPQLFFELTAIWPCKYLTNRCTTVSSQVVGVINDDTNVRMRDEMRQGNFLWLNGKQYPVILDDGITEDNSTTSASLNPGEFASDIYFLPLRAKGMPVLYWEHLDYSKAIADLTPMLQQKSQFWSTDGGRYMWALQNLNYCFKFQGKVEPRVILRTPQLCGRLQNVKYTPLQHLRDPMQDSPYFVKGGAPSFSTPPTYYSEWNAR